VSIAVRPVSMPASMARSRFCVRARTDRAEPGVVQEQVEGRPGTAGRSRNDQADDGPDDPFELERSPWFSAEKIERSSAPHTP